MSSSSSITSDEKGSANSSKGHDEMQEQQQQESEESASSSLALEQKLHRLSKRALAAQQQQDEDSATTMPADFTEMKESVMSNVSVMPALERASPEPPRSTPGAFPVAGIGDSGAAAANDAEEEEIDISIADAADSDEEDDQAPYSARLVLQSAECTLDNDKDDGVTIDAIPMGGSLPPPKDAENNNLPKSKRYLAAGGASLVIVLVLALVLGLTLTDRDSSSNNNNIQEETVSSETHDSEEPFHYPPFNESLLELDTITAISQDPQSPQARANAWMWNDPNLETYPDWRKIQRFGMVTKYYATNGDYWYHNDHWLSYEVSECDWYTSHPTPPCDNEGHLLVDDFHSNNLTGSMPREGLLGNFVYSDHSHNQLHGPLPRINPLKSLEVFMISNNSLAGPLIAVGNFEALNLRIIKFDSNQLEGEYLNIIPPLLPRLEVVNLTSNHFRGRFPTSWLPNSKLQYVGLGHNQMYGSLTTELGYLKDLQELDISGNEQVTGSIPIQVASLKKLVHLNVDGTSMTGAIPEGLCARQKADNLTILANCSSMECC